MESIIQSKSKFGSAFEAESELEQQGYRCVKDHWVKGQSHFAQVNIVTTQSVVVRYGKTYK